MLLLASMRVFCSMVGGNEFQGGSQSAQSADAIQVDAETMRRLGLKVEPVSRQRLALASKPLDKLNHCPTNRLEVTTPVNGDAATGCNQTR